MFGFGEEKVLVAGIAGNNRPRILISVFIGILVSQSSALGCCLTLRDFTLEGSLTSYEVCCPESLSLGCVGPLHPLKGDRLNPFLRLFSSKDSISAQIFSTCPRAPQMRRQLLSGCYIDCSMILEIVYLRTPRTSVCNLSRSGRRP